MAISPTTAFISQNSVQRAQQGITQTAPVNTGPLAFISAPGRANAPMSVGRGHVRPSQQNLVSFNRFASSSGLQETRSLRQPPQSLALFAQRPGDRADGVSGEIARMDGEQGDSIRFNAHSRDAEILNQLPRFEERSPQALADAVKQAIDDCQATLATAISQVEPSWDTVVAPCMEADEQLSKQFQALGHLHGVKGTQEVQKAYGEALDKVTNYGVSLGQNTKLYQAINAIKQGPEYATLNQAQQAVIDKKIKDFELSGVHLPPAEKKRLADITQALSQKSTEFAQNVLTATQGWTKQISDVKQLKGLPQPLLNSLAQAAKEKGQSGFLITLDGPVYQQVMTHVENRSLRESLYKAYMTRASQSGPDNTAVIKDILKLRQEKAQLLGFNNHAEVSVATKMAESPQQVIDFLRALLAVAKPQAEADIARLSEFANRQDGVKQLAPWDLAFYSEQLKQEKFEVSSEDLRPYFPVDRVLNGLVEVVEKLHNVKLVPRDNVQTWHSDVKYFDVNDANGQRQGGLYMDLIARPDKRGGAWMDVVHNRLRTTTGDLQLPVANLVCNFMPPQAGEKAQLTPDEVRTLFHEMGHSLHHLLTQVDYPDIGGINGVAWDAVELPSQLMENWSRHTETLPLLTQHVEHGDPLPEVLEQKLKATENFQSGIGLVRQIELSLFDLYAHLAQENTDDVDTKKVMADVKKETELVKTPKGMAFENAFSHIFAGGYDAGYYSYLWAKVLAADAFSRFDESGIFDPEVSESLRDTILSQGGVKGADQLFHDFMGRDPDKDALLKQLGLLPPRPPSND